MTAFRIIAALALIGLAAWIARDLLRRMHSWKAAWQLLHREVSASRAARHGGTAPAPLKDALRRIIYVFAGAFLILLALSGFAPVLLMGAHVSGMLLVLHVTIAPLFALSLCALALFWAHRLRFNRSDLQVVRDIRHHATPEEEPLTRFMLKCGFWTILLLSLPLMLTIILSLFPIFGTEGEAMLIRLHGYSALLLLLAAVAEIHLTFVFMARKE